MRKGTRFLLGTIAASRYSRQIVSLGPGVQVNGTAGGTTLAVPWTTTAGSVTANVRNYMAIAVKPGTANGGGVTTPAGWTLAASHIGGGYGGTLADGTGNVRVFLYYKDNDNTSTGTLSVTINPDGANGVGIGIMGRLEKLKGSWQSVVTSSGEATVDTNAGSYTLSPSMSVAVGDVLVYGWGITTDWTGSAALTAGGDLTSLVPPLASGGFTLNGYNIGVVATGRRAKRGETLGTQVLTLPTGGPCRGPMVVARFRVR